MGPWPGQRRATARLPEQVVVGGLTSLCARDAICRDATRGAPTSQCRAPHGALERMHLMSNINLLITTSIAVGLTTACTDPASDQAERPDASPAGGGAWALAGACSTPDECGCPGSELSDTVELWTGAGELADAAAVDGRLGVAMIEGIGYSTVARLRVAHLDAMDAGFQHDGGLGGGGALYYVSNLSLTSRPGGFTAAYSRVDHTHGTARCVALALDPTGAVTTYSSDLRSGRGCDQGDFTWAGDYYSLLTTGTNRDLIAEQYPPGLATTYPYRRRVDGPTYSIDMRQQSWDGQRLFVAYRKLAGTTLGEPNVEVFARVVGQGLPIQLSSAPGNTYWPTLASGPDGTAAAWIDRTPQGYVTRFTVLDPDARPRFPAVDLQTSGSYSLTGLSLAASSAGYAVAWVDSARQLWVVALAGSGAAVAPPRILATGAKKVRLVSDHGVYWAVWQAEGAVRATRICGS